MLPKSVSSLSLLVLLFPALLAAQSYKPTPDQVADPHLALEEARELTRKGNYRKALDRHVWYHENALALDPAQLGVRNSFALADWRALADEYEPAGEELARQRLLAMRSALDGEGDAAAVRDAADLSFWLEDLPLMDEFCAELSAEGSELASPCRRELRRVQLRTQKERQTTD